MDSPDKPSRDTSDHLEATALGPQSAEQTAVSTEPTAQEEKGAVALVSASPEEQGAVAMEPASVGEQAAVSMEPTAPEEKGAVALEEQGATALNRASPVSDPMLYWPDLSETSEALGSILSTRTSVDLQRATSIAVGTAFGKLQDHGTINTNKVDVHIANLNIDAPPPPQREEEGPSTGTEDSFTDKVRLIANELRENLPEKLSTWYPSVLGLEDDDSIPLHIPQKLERLEKQVSPTVGAKVDEQRPQKHSQQKEETVTKTGIDILNQMTKGGRVFISGNAGFGKSSFVNNTARKWVISDKSLRHIPLLFPIPLRLVRHSSIVDVICYDLCLIDPLFKHNLTNIFKIQSIIKDVVFMLDSYDELNPMWQENSELQNMIAGGQYKNARVLTTTRPQFLNELLINGQPSMLTFSLLPLTLNESLEFLNMIAGREKCQPTEYINLTKAAARIHETLLCIPLYLALFCGMWLRQKSSILVAFSTNTSIMNAFIRASLNSSINKEIKTKGVDFKQSPLEDTVPTDMKQKLIHLGKACFEAVQDKRSHLQTSHLKSVHISSEDCSKLGIGNLNPDGSLTFSNTLLRDYLAAIYLCSNNAELEAFLNNFSEKVQAPAAAAETMPTKLEDNTWSFSIPALHPNSLLFLNEQGDSGTMLNSVRPYEWVFLFSVGMDPKVLSSLIDRNIVFKIAPSWSIQNDVYHQYESILYTECQDRSVCDRFVKYFSSWEVLNYSNQERPLNIKFAHLYSTPTHGIIASMKEQGLIPKIVEKLGILGQNIRIATVNRSRISVSGDEINFNGPLGRAMLEVTSVVNAGKLVATNIIIDWPTLCALDGKCECLIFQSVNLDDSKSEVKPGTLLTCLKILILHGCTNAENFSARIQKYCPVVENCVIIGQPNMFCSEWIHQQLKSVISLYLSQCGPLDMANIFSMFPNIASLQLKEVTIKPADDKDFQEGICYIGLHTLNVESCTNVTMQWIHCYFPKIQRLHLKNSNIVGLDSFICQYDKIFSYVSHLNIEYCGDMDIRDLIHAFPNLHQLQLSENSEHSMGDQHRNNTAIRNRWRSVKTLFMSPCLRYNIHELEETFPSLESLSVIGAENMFSRRTKVSFKHVHTLSILLCSNVNVGVIHRTFPNVKFICFNNNTFVYPPRTLDMTSVAKLFIQNCDGDIQKLLASCPNIEKLAIGCVPVPNMPLGDDMQRFLVQVPNIGNVAAYQMRPATPSQIPAVKFNKLSLLMHHCTSDIDLGKELRNMRHLTEMVLYQSTLSHKQSIIPNGHTIQKVHCIACKESVNEQIKQLLKHITVETHSNNAQYQTFIWTHWGIRSGVIYKDDATSEVVSII